MRANNKMPDWMMDYAAAIGDKSYNEYQNLASKYRADIKNYYNNILPKQAKNIVINPPAPKPETWGAGVKKTIQKDTDPDLYLHYLDEKYKKEALDIACKYGYERPPDSVAAHYEAFTKLQENSKFATFIKPKDKKFHLSHEDVIATEAHKKYFVKHPEAKENHNNKKNELRWVERAEQQSDPFNPEPEKKADKQKEKNIDDPQHSIDMMQERFMNKFDRYSRDEPETKDMNMDRNDRDDI